MEAQAALKKELATARRERQEALESRDDMADMTDTLEMATLDKEMAEEKVLYACSFLFILKTIVKEFDLYFLTIYSEAYLALKTISS